MAVQHICLDVAVAEVGLQRPRIVALVSQRKATGVPQHVRMDLKSNSPARSIMRANPDTVSRSS